MPPSSTTLPLLFRSLLWRRARRLIAVPAVDIGVGDAHGATCAFTRPGTRVPFPGTVLLMSAGTPGVQVWVDIGLRERRRHPDDHGQTTQAIDTVFTRYHQRQ